MYLPRAKHHPYEHIIILVVRKNTMQTSLWEELNGVFENKANA